MTYKIFQVYKPERTVFNVNIIKFNTREEMVEYCLSMDNDSFFYYGALTR